MKMDVALNPVEAGPLGMDRIVVQAHHRPDLAQQLWSLLLTIDRRRVENSR